MSAPSKTSEENHLTIDDEPAHAVVPCARCESPASAEGLRATWFSDGRDRAEIICASCSDTWNSRRPHMRDARTFLGELKADRNEFPNRKDMEMARREAERSASQGLPFGPGDTVRRIRDAEGRIDLGDTVTVAECRLWIQRLDGPPYGCKRTFVRTTDGRDLFGDFVVVAKSAAAQVEPAFDTDINLGDRVRVLELYGWAAHERANGPRVGEIHTVARSLGGYPVPGRSGFVEIDCGRPVGLDKDKLRRDCFVARFELVERAGQAVKASAPAYDEDIRVGDLVEVVSHDEEAMLKSGWVATAQAVGSRAVVRSTCCSSLGMKQTFCLFEPGDLRGAHGRFRVIERDGKPYTRAVRQNDAVSTVATRDHHGRPGAYVRIVGGGTAGLKASGGTGGGTPNNGGGGHLHVTARRPLPALPTPKPKLPDLPTLPSIGIDLASEPSKTVVHCMRVGDESTGEFDVTVTVPAPPVPDAHVCAWCGKDPAPNITFDRGKWCCKGSCHEYVRALNDRLEVGGASDCTEERESVRRYVDALAAEKRDERTRWSENQIEMRMQIEGRSLHREPLPEIDPVSGWTAWANPGSES